MYLILIGGLLILYLPTIVYVCVAIDVIRKAIRRGWRWATIASVTMLLLPFLPWEAARIHADWRRAELTRFNAGLSKRPMSNMLPDTIFMNAYGSTLSGSPLIDCPLQIIWNKQLLGERYTGAPLVSLDRETGRELGPAKLPAKYLKLSTYSDSVIQPPGGPSSYSLGPFELRLIGPEADNLVDYMYEEAIDSPTFPPVLTWVGWISKPIAYPPKKSPSDFVNETLGNCAQPPAARGRAP